MTGSIRQGTNPPSTGPAVSVVLPFRNAAWCLETQLRALAGQRCDHLWELILVENGSTDAWEAVVRPFAETFPVPLRILQVPPGPGPGHAYNAGFRAARGRWVAACDADDRVDPRWLVSLLALAQEDRLISGSCRLWDGSEGPCRSPLWNSGSFPHLGGPPVALSGNVLMSRALFNGLGGFRPDYATAEDCELSWRAAERGVAVIPAWRAVIDYRSRPTLSGTLRQKIRQGRDDIRLLRDYRGRVRLERSDPLAPRWFPPLSALVVLAIPGVSRESRCHAVERWGKWIGHALGRIRA